MNKRAKNGQHTWEFNVMNYVYEVYYYALHTVNDP